MIKIIFILLAGAFSFGSLPAQSIGGAVNPSATTVCSGTNSGLLTLSGHTGNIVRWQSSVNNGASWSNISNTTVSLVYSNLTQTTWYRCEVLLSPSPPNISAYSTPAVITVDAASSGMIASSTSVCSGSNSGSLSLSGTFTNVNAWESSADGGNTWTPISSTTTTLSYSDLTATTMYRASVTNGTCPAANATAATITVHPLSVGGIVSGSDTVCSNSNSGALLLSGNTGNVIRWQYSDDNGASWTNISNTSGIYNFSNIEQTTKYRAVVQSGNCLIENSSPAAITVDPASIGGIISTGATVCNGNNNGTLILSDYTGNIIRWESSSNGGNTWVPIANNSTNFTYNNLSSSTSYRVLVKSGLCDSAYSSAVTITVAAASVGGSISGSDTVCSSTNSGTLLLSGYTGNILRWQYSTNEGISWSAIANTTPYLYYANLSANTNYRAVVQNSTCPIINSAEAGITITPMSEGGIVSSDATVCSGINNGVLQLTNQIGTIQSWEKSTNNGSSWDVVANTGDTLSYFNLTSKTLFRTNVKNSDCPAKKSTTAVITTTAPSAGGSVSGSDTVCSDSNSGTLSLSGYNGNIIRWQYSDDEGINWSNISNTTSLYNFSNISTTTIYRAVVQNGSCPIMNSTEEAITVVPATEGGIVSADAAVCSGINNGVLQLKNHIGTILNWEKSTDNGSSWNAVANTSDTLNYFNLTSTTFYKATVQSGNCTAKKSTTAVITTTSPSAGGMVSGSDTVCSDSNSGTLLLNGYSGDIILWQHSTDGGISWSTISNTSPIQNYSNISASTQYRAIVQNGTCPSANSSSATIAVLPLSDGGTLSPVSYSACGGANSGSIHLYGENGTIIKWEYSTDGGSVWNTVSNTSGVQNFQNLSVTTIYRVNVQYGDCATAYSSLSAIHVSPPSVGGTIIGSDTVCTGSNSGLLALTGYTGSIHNWEHSINNGVTWSSIANTSCIQNYINLSSTIQYRAIVESGACPAANSDFATIVVSPLSDGGTLLSSKFICDSTTAGTLLLTGFTGSILNWESSVDSGNTWNEISNTSNIQIFAGITQTTMYRAEVKSGDCMSAYSSFAIISLTPHASASYSFTIAPPHPGTVVFHNTSTSNNGTCFWNFGDNTTSTAFNPAHTYTANGSYSVALIVTDSCGSDTIIQNVNITGVGVNELTYNNPEVRVYPNPTSGIFNVQLSPFENLKMNSIEIYNVYGEKVYARDASEQPLANSASSHLGLSTLTVNFSEARGGIYFYVIKSLTGTICTGKIVKE